MKSPRVANRLVGEKSPYLKQHAFNPVHWFPWSEQAFQKARAEDKPIFLSIGYSTCHWCHVMERESFEDADVARLMNETFVSIKVDREERPDIDSYYMTVCQAMTGTGGWPLTIFMSPDQKPFLAATYLPKENRHGRAGLLQLIPRIKEMWRNQRDSIFESAQQVTEYVKQIASGSTGGKLDDNILTRTYDLLSDAYDEAAGGFGPAPKFPTTQHIFFLLRHFLRTKTEGSRTMVEHTLRSMRMGGIYDHVGHGFHRYSTDDHWRTPHFEKMLYDQALLTMAYTEAFQLTGNMLFQKTAEHIIAYVLRDMKSPESTFYTAEDADSEGGEGLYYLWTAKEISKILGPGELEVFTNAFNIKRDGNYTESAARIPMPRNLLYMTKSSETLAAESGLTPEEFGTRLHSALEKIFANRSKRTRPHKDMKVLCDWNGLMIAALSRAARVLANDDYLRAAQAAATFILKSMRTSHGGLYHQYMEGEPAVGGFLDDYAFLIWGLIELFQATFIPVYLQEALSLTERASELFWDARTGSFFSTAEDSELPIRMKESYDGAVPSGNAIAASNHIRLGRLTGRPELEEKSFRILDAFGKRIGHNPLGHTQALVAFYQAVSPAPHVVIYGEAGSQDTLRMVRTVNTSKDIDTTVIHVSEGDSALMGDIAPSIRHFKKLNGKTTAYVCRDYRCERPTNSVEQLSAMLENDRTRKGKPGSGISV